MKTVKHSDKCQLKLKVTSFCKCHVLIVEFVEALRSLSRAPNIMQILSESSNEMKSARNTLTSESKPF